MSSYRTPLPSTHFLDQLEKEVSSNQLQTPGTVAFSEGERGEGVAEEEEGEDVRKDDIEGEGAESGKLSKQEARRLRRENRKKEVYIHVCVCV